MRTLPFFIAVFLVSGASAQIPLSSAFDGAVATPAATNVVPAPVDVVVETGPRASITFSQRLAWFSQKTFGPRSFATAIPGAALDTLIDYPREAGPHWSGFGARYGATLSTNGLSNGIEAGLGAVWGEDPRYSRVGGESGFKSRLGHVMVSTVMASNRQGELRPAYARYAAFSGASFISDGWRYPSDTTTGAAMSRIAFAFLGRMGSNAFDEFWPDTKRKLFHHAPKD